ncbi:MAG: HisA/HisF-related TIM barrel protein [Burkholderiaceae bacterium]|nr:HisA/HisF-related TIM barrel protein [Burkholderiaceae bacterium]
MQVIPVIDLAGGVVVRAVRGERERYRPIESRLVAGCEPVAVARALLDYTAAATLYVADLDAIRGGGVQTDALQALRAALPPACALWLDAGFARVDDGVALCRRLGAAVVPVFGSESLADAAELQQLGGRDDALLSLDQRGGAPLDPAGCFAQPQWWPQRVIVMTLDRVGSGSGPDLSALQWVRERAGTRVLIGAGGVRHVQDLAAAAAAGAQAWLVASALHDGTLPPARPR